MAPGLWNCLEGMETPAAVLAEWRKLTGPEFGAVRGWLRVTQRQAAEYPCLAERDCGCRHEVVEFDDLRWLARCQCERGGCPAPRLEPTDLIIHELDVPRFGTSVARLLGFAEPEGNGALQLAPRAWPVGQHGATRSPVFLLLCNSEAQLLANLEGLAGSCGEPFIVLAPTARVRTEVAGAWLQRARCAFVPLATCLVVDAQGALCRASSIEPLLDRFAKGLNTNQGIAPVLEGIHREIRAVRDDRRELVTAKERLAAMHGEGLFAFAKQVDQEAREQFMAIMASGDVAKAARELGLKDPTLRSKLAQWPKRGKAYAALAEMVRWRKAIKGEAGREHAKRVASGAERDVDFPTLIRDVVEELECLAPENWEERTESLAETLRRAVG